MNQKELLFISIAVFLTILFMVVVDINKARNSSIIEKDIPQIQTPKLKLDLRTFENLKNRQY